MRRVQGGDTVTSKTPLCETWGLLWSDRCEVFGQATVRVDGGPGCMNLEHIRSIQR